MFCPNCQKKLQENEKTCQQCGYELNKVDTVEYHSKQKNIDVGIIVSIVIPAIALLFYLIKGVSPWNVIIAYIGLSCVKRVDSTYKKEIIVAKVLNWLLILLPLCVIVIQSIIDLINLK